jgi:hypothetical protein
MLNRTSARLKKPTRMGPFSLGQNLYVLEAGGLSHCNMHILVANHG